MTQTSIRPQTLLVPLTIILSAAGAVEQARAEPESLVVLSRDSFWRVHVTWKTEMVRTADGKLQPVLTNYRGRRITVRGGDGKVKPLVPEVSVTALPAEGWAEPDFDDSDWPRMKLPLPVSTPKVALFSVRGRFKVVDPAKAGDVSLSLDYRGGAVVYLNGKEVARAHLAEGRLDPLALAEDYPKEAYLRPDGTILKRSHGDPRKFPERLALRNRRLEKVKIPTAMLRPGLNVLAIELHRAPTDEALYTARAKGTNDRRYFNWSMLGLAEVRLTALAGAAVVPNASRPTGTQLWNHGIAQQLHVTDYGDPDESPAPVRIVGCRNGAFSGKVVLSSTDPIRGLKVTATSLGAGESGGVIPADAVQVRFGVPDGRTRREPDWFSGIEDEVPAEVAVHAQGGAAMVPIWITVRVAGDASPGDYTGKLAINTDCGRPIEAAVALKVIDWSLPDAEEFFSHVGLMQSPESVAMRYNVPMWSEQHWKLLEKTFALFGQVGADDLYIPLLCRTHMGNEHSMVRWIKDETGGYKHDFSIAERYIDLAVRHMGKIPVVCLYVWEANTGSIRYSGRDELEQKAGIPFTLFDSKTEKLTVAEGPRWGTPEMHAFFKPVIRGLRERLAKRGLEKSAMLGLPNDARPRKATFDDFKAISPDLPWVLHSHAGPRGFAVGYGAHVWITTPIRHTEVSRAYGWKRQEPYIFCLFPRAGPGALGSIRPGGRILGVYRRVIEALLVTNHHGLGRVGADFWPVTKDKRGRGHSILNRYPVPGMSVSVNDGTAAVLNPGREGAISTVRFEMLREGIQESEARIFLERILTDPARRAGLGEKLARQTQRALDERVRAMVRLHSTFLNPNDIALFPASNWQGDSERLYGLAARAAKVAVQEGSR